jgi:hypothetical protein
MSMALARGFVGAAVAADDDDAAGLLEHGEAGRSRNSRAMRTSAVVT